MHTVDKLRPQHCRALAQAGEIVAHVHAADLARATPCAGWDLQVLLSHMIGQNDGFATAVTAGDAPQSAYTRTPVTASDLASEWRRSADRVQAAFAHAHTDDEVRLIEINPDNTVPVAAAVGMHLLDTVIHTWDVAISLGNPYRPDDELLEIVAAGAKQVPAGASRTEPGAAFAPAVTTDQTDSWLILRQPASRWAIPDRRSRLLCRGHEVFSRPSSARVLSGPGP